MSVLQRRIASLEASAGKAATTYAILPEGFTGQLPPNVTGIRTGVPRHDDDPARFKFVGPKL